MTVDDSGGLSRRGLRGGLLVSGGQLARTLVQFVGLVVLARLLRPEDFGVVAMATAVVGVTAVLSDMGLSVAILRSRDLPKSVRDGIFYANALGAMGVSVAIFLMAPAVVLFYGDPRLLAVTQWLAIASFLGGLVPQYRAELAQRHAFMNLSLTEVLAQLAGLLCAVIAASVGAGYWAVVAQQIAASAVLLAMFVVLTRYIPAWPPRFRGVGEHVGLGATALAVQATNYVAVNLAPAALGRLAGASAVGLYSRAYQLVSLPLVQLAAPLTRVVIPLLAHVKHKGDLMSAAVRVHLALSYVLLPILMFILVGGAPLVSLLFGDAWREAGQLTQILAVGGIFQVLGYIYYWIHVHLGRLVSLWAYELVTWATVAPLYFVFASHGSWAVASLYSLGLALNWLIVGTIGMHRLALSGRHLLFPSLRRIAWLVPVGAAGLSARGLAESAGYSDLWCVLASVGGSLVGLCFVLASRAFRNELSAFGAMAREVVAR